MLRLKAGWPILSLNSLLLLSHLTIIVNFAIFKTSCQCGIHDIIWSHMSPSSKNHFINSYGRTTWIIKIYLIPEIFSPLQVNERVKYLPSFAHFFWIQAMLFKKLLPLSLGVKSHCWRCNHARRSYEKYLRWDFGWRYLRWTEFFVLPEPALHTIRLLRSSNASSILPRFLISMILSMLLCC